MSTTSYAVSVGAVLCFAGAAFGQQSHVLSPIPDLAMTENSVGGFSSRGTTIVYTGIPGPYSAFAAATGSLGIDDYDSIAVTPTGQS